MKSAEKNSEWKATACNLCYANCGLLVKTGGADGRQILKVKGDKAHPASKGYLCNKAAQINYYQNAKDRLRTPLRRKADGTYEEINWDRAIHEISTRMMAIRDQFGGDKIFRYGGGGQGNHLGGGYFSPVFAALNMKYSSNALAQEKTGLAWMMGRMFGTNVHGELSNTDCLFIVGKNPWQSNSIQQARTLLKALSRSPEKTLIVVDPRRTESADLADIHLAVTPGRDAWLLSAMIAYVVQKGFVPSDWLDKHTVGLEAVRRTFSEIDVDAFSRFAGVSPDDVKAAALAIARSKRSAYYEDLGVQMAPHSTLVSYLNLLLLSITGHFGRKGTMGPLKSLVGNFFNIEGIGSVSEDGYETLEKKSPVAGSRIIGGLVPCNVIPSEIMADHPNRYRALWVESGNPCHSLANSSEWRRAMRALDLSVVIDVAMTETARLADYVLPASSQYEKWESTFFNFEYPDNHHHLRHPLLDPLDGTLSEPEMHARFIEAMNPFDLSEIEPLKQAAKQGLDAFTKAVFEGMAVNPHWGAFAPYILYRTLGPELPDDAAAAAQYWALAHQFAARHSESVRRAGFVGEGAALGNDLFRGILAARSGVVFSVSNIEESFSELGFSDHKIRLAVGEMLDEVVTLADMRDLVPRDSNFPLLLAAGERRAYTANTIIRDPRWIKKAEVAALAIHSEDAAEVGVLDGGIVLLHTKSGSVRVTVYFEDRMKRGTISLPNGLGLIYPDDTGTEVEHGIAPNELTSSDLKDKFLGTPLHKHVPARLETV